MYRHYNVSFLITKKDEISFLQPLINVYVTSGLDLEMADDLQSRPDDSYKKDIKIYPNLAIFCTAILLVEPNLMKTGIVSPFKFDSFVSVIKSDSIVQNNFLGMKYETILTCVVVDVNVALHMHGKRLVTSLLVC